MTRFNSKGMWRIPTGKRRKSLQEIDEDLVIRKCYCPNGHDLINPKVNVRGYNGILIKVKRGKEEGLMALSPICGDKSKYTIDIELNEGEIIELLCPVCNVPLPVYAPCDCGADMITLFCDKHGNFCNCIGIVSAAATPKSSGDPNCLTSIAEEAK